ncbi:hypothetical protein ES5_08146, partial [Dietzia cinnamea P4]
GEAGEGGEQGGQGDLEVRQPDGARPAPGFPDLLRPFLPRPNVLPQPDTVGAAAVGGNATVAETTAEDEATDAAESDERGE